MSQKLNKKILHIVPRLERGGVERCVVDESVFLKDKMQPIVMSGGGQLVAELKQAHVRHVQWSVYTKNPVRIVLNAIRLVFFCRHESINLIHVHSRAPAWMVFLATRFIKIRWGTTFHGLYGAKNKFKRFYNRVMLKGDFVFTPSQCVVDHLKSVYGFQKAKVIPRWIDLKKFDVKKIAFNAIHAQQKKWGFSKTDTIFMIPGRLSRIKGQKLFLEAFVKLKEKNVKALIFGSGSESYKQELLSFVQEKNISDRVIFDEGQFQPIHYASVSCVVGATLKPETFGLTMLEAQAMGTPVICARQGGFLDIIQEGETGFFFTPKSAQDLSQKMKEFIAFSDDKKRMFSTQASKNVKRFEISLLMKRVLALYGD
ncbi:MAG: glycosyltransferase [Alphaproteobacteria bacterium]|nr:glycosyltransferase [Alphaproteobacteria bacterium]